MEFCIFVLEKVVSRWYIDRYTIKQNLFVTIHVFLSSKYQIYYFTSIHIKNFEQWPKKKKKKKKENV